MRTHGWLIALLVNLFVVAAFAPSMFEGDIVGFVASDTAVEKRPGSGPAK